MHHVHCSEIIYTPLPPKKKKDLNVHNTIKYVFSNIINNV